MTVPAFWHADQCCDGSGDDEYGEDEEEEEEEEEDSEQDNVEEYEEDEEKQSSVQGAPCRISMSSFTSFCSGIKSPMTCCVSTCASFSLLAGYASLLLQQNRKEQNKIKTEQNRVEQNRPKMEILQPVIPSWTGRRCHQACACEWWGSAIIQTRWYLEWFDLLCVKAPLPSADYLDCLDWVFKLHHRYLTA